MAAMHVFEQQPRDLGERLSEARHCHVKMFERYRGLSKFLCLSRPKLNSVAQLQR